MKRRRNFIAIAATVLLVSSGGTVRAQGGVTDGSAGPLGEWPDFTPIGFITAPHPNIPKTQTHLYGDWGSIVGEETLFLQDGQLKLLYHSFHETYLTVRLHGEVLLQDWALGYDAVTKIKFTPLVQPGGPAPGSAWLHTDTPSYLHHPVTGEHLLYNSMRPGTKDDNPAWVALPGAVHTIQVSTSATPPSIGTPFTQDWQDILQAEFAWEQGFVSSGQVKGGLSEPTPVWVPQLGKVRLFYRGLNGAAGSFWNWRISYADSDDGRTGWVKNPVPNWDPSVPGNPANVWAQPYPVGFSFRGAWQAHVTGDPVADGVHMVLTVSNQNFAGGGHIAYYWSPDWGDTWIGHPDNPILVAGTHPAGPPATGFQRTPCLIVDEAYDRYILGYNAGWDASQSHLRRTHLAVADRPVSDPNAFVDVGHALAGAAGDPVLIGQASLVVGAPYSLVLSDAAPAATAWLVIGLGQVDLPFKQGVLVPDPVWPLETAADGGGGVELVGTWPAGIPAGLQLVLQFWIQDATGPAGFTASNGLSGIVP